MIGVIIIILSFIAVAMLLSPITISVNSARSGGKIDGFLSLGWIMFMFRYRLKDKQTEILVLGRRVAGLTHKDEPVEHKEKRKSMKVKKSGKMPHLGDIFKLSRPTLRLFKDIIYSFRIKFLDIDITFGLKDPALTGIMTGFLHSIPLLASHTIRWTPDFTREIMEWDIRAKAAITPIQILAHIIRFISNRQVLSSGLRIIRD